MLSARLLLALASTTSALLLPQAVSSSRLDHRQAPRGAVTLLQGQGSGQKLRAVRAESRFQDACMMASGESKTVMILFGPPGAGKAWAPKIVETLGILSCYRLRLRRMAEALRSGSSKDDGCRCSGVRRARRLDHSRADQEDDCEGGFILDGFRALSCKDAGRDAGRCGRQGDPGAGA